MPSVSAPLTILDPVGGGVVTNFSPSGTYFDFHSSGRMRWLGPNGTVVNMRGTVSLQNTPPFGGQLIGYGFGINDVFTQATSVLLNLGDPGTSVPVEWVAVLNTNDFVSIMALSYSVSSALSINTVAFILTAFV